MIESFGVKMYTTIEVAKLLGVSRETLLSYVKKTDIPTRTLQRYRYYTEEDIRKILQIPKKAK